VLLFKPLNLFALAVGRINLPHNTLLGNLELTDLGWGCQIKAPVCFVYKAMRYPQFTHCRVFARPWWEYSLRESCCLRALYRASLCITLGSRTRP